MNILITSAGTASAVSVIKSLNLQQEVPVHLVATDMDPLAPGLFLADEYYFSPPVKEEEKYLSSLLGAIKKYRIDVLIPIFSREISFVAKYRKVLEEAGARLLLHPVAAIDLVNNKKSMALHVAQLGIQTPPCLSEAELNALSTNAFPLFCKPQTGSSSKGTFKVDDETDLHYLRNKYPGSIFQPFVEGQEVTIDILCDQQSRPLVISPRTRLSVKGGQSVKAEIISPDRFQEAVTKIAQSLNLQGPCNMQFMYTDDELVFIEMNPRYAAGGLMLTTHSGLNIPLIHLKLLMNMAIDEAQLNPHVGWKMTRYWEEIILTDQGKPVEPLK